MLIGAEFLAMILVIVYVGAVAVLFLFVVMMLDINFAELREGFLRYLPVGALIGIVLLAELLLVLGGWAVAPRCRRRSAKRRCRRRGDRQHRGARPPALHPLLLPVPGGGPDPAGRDDRRHRADPAHRGRACAASDIGEQVNRPHGRRRRPCVKVPTRGGRVMAIGLAHYLTVAAILFTLGIFGIFLNRKNVIVILMSIELMLLAVNINLVAFSVCAGRPRRARSSPCSC